MIDNSTTFKFKDGTVVNHPHIQLEYLGFSVLVSPLVLQNGEFRGFTQFRDDGNGYAPTVDSGTKGSFFNVPQAIEAAKQDAIEKYGLPNFIQVYGP